MTGNVKVTRVQTDIRIEKNYLVSVHKLVEIE
jgi:hypothetical protein